MRYRLLLLYSIVCILLNVGCSRDSFSISSVTLFPIVVATHSAAPNATLSEGLAVAVLATPLNKGEQYQLAISPPSSLYRWEVAVLPFETADLWYLGSSDLLLPPEFELESGLYEVEVFVPDGRRFFQDVEFNRSKQAVGVASGQVGALEPLEWVTQGSSSWILTGYASEEKHIWRYTFYDSSDKVLYTKESSAATITGATSIKEATTTIIASRFDDALGVFLVVRTLFT